MSYNKIDYTQFLKTLKNVFNDVNIRHDENFKFILKINVAIYGKSFMSYIEYSRDIILLAVLKTIIEEYDFLIVKKNKHTLLYTKENFILTSKTDNINSLYENLKYLNLEYNKIVRNMETTLNTLYSYFYTLNNDKSLLTKEEYDNLTLKYNSAVKESFYPIHLYFCVKFILCNLSCIKVFNKTNKDLVIQRNIKYLYYILDNPNNTKHDYLSNHYKKLFNDYLFEYCKYNRLLKDDGSINCIVVEDFLVNDFFKIIYFDTKIKDACENCFIQLNGNITPKKTLDNFSAIIYKKKIVNFNVLIDN